MILTSAAPISVALAADLAQDGLQPLLASDLKTALAGAATTNGTTLAYTNAAVTKADVTGGTTTTTNLTITITKDSESDTVVQSVGLTATARKRSMTSGADSNDAPSTSNNADEHTHDEGTAPQVDDMKMEEAPLPKEESQPESQQESPLPKEEEKTTTTRRRRR